MMMVWWLLFETNQCNVLNLAAGNSALGAHLLRPQLVTLPLQQGQFRRSQLWILNTRFIFKASTKHRLLKSWKKDSYFSFDYVYSVLLLFDCSELRGKIFS